MSGSPLSVSDIPSELPHTEIKAYSGCPAQVSLQIIPVPGATCQLPERPQRRITQLDPVKSRTISYNDKGFFCFFLTHEHFGRFITPQGIRSDRQSA